MNTEIYVIIALLIFHWIGDFVLQSDADAKGKSESMKHLFSHTGIYSLNFLTFSFFASVWVGNYILFLAPITFICHTIQDYYTSRVNKMLMQSGNTHSYYVSFGFDQLLHFIQLILTYQLLTP